MPGHDVIVLGLGGMGTAAAYHLARRGARVLGLDMHPLAHDHGSSHGETRLIRKAYLEGPQYVPLLDRSYDLWDELSEATGHELLHRVGLVLFGRADSSLARAREVARRCGVDVDVLPAPDACARFPTFVAPSDHLALWEPGAGYLEVERCVSAHAALARKHGAELRTGEEALSWSASPGEVTVVTRQGRHQAAELVIAAGPWAPRMLADLGLPLRVHRVVLVWLQAPPVYDTAPCFAFDTPEGFFYGFPRLPGSSVIKVAEHLPGAAVASPEETDREVHERDARPVEAFARAHLAGITLPFVRGKTCLYTMTPDEHFVVDAHPAHENVHFAAGFSGHGFKFAPVIGECLADLTLERTTRHPIEFLRLRW